MATYTLESNRLVNAIGTVRFAIAAYASKSDRKTARRIIIEGWEGVSPKAAEALLSRRIDYTVDREAETVTFTFEERK
jgi:hypothetical protein